MFLKLIMIHMLKKKDFIYLFDREKECKHKQGELQEEGEGEAGAGEGAEGEGVGSPPSREPNMGPTPGP